MKYFLIATVLSLNSCASAPTPSRGDLEAYCAIQAYRLKNGTPFDSLREQAKANHVTLSLRADSSVVCLAVIK